MSLLAPCDFRLRRKNGDRWDRQTITVEPRSACLMSGPARSEWEHSIPPLAKHRYSVTLRTLRLQAKIKCVGGAFGPASTAEGIRRAEISIRSLAQCVGDDRTALAHGQGRARGRVNGRLMFHLRVDGGAGNKDDD